MKKRIVRFLLVVFVLSLLPVTVFAAPRIKTGTITGSVSEMRFDLPLPLNGVTVKLEGTERTVQTNKLGRYTLANVEIGEAKLLYSKEGYEPITKTVTIKANKLNNVYATMKKAITAPLINISGEVKAKYEVVDVLATVIRIFPDALPKILELIIPKDIPLRDQVIAGLLKLDSENILEVLDSPWIKALIGDVDLFELMLKNFNPQDLITLIPNIPDEIKALLLQIVPSSISNEIALPGTIITVRDAGRVMAVTIADKNGAYKLNIPENYEVEYRLYGFETKKMIASKILKTTFLLTSPGIVKGTVTGENNQPLNGALVTVTSAEGKPSSITNSKGKYEIKGVKRLLPGFAGGIGAHTVLFDKDEYSLAKATVLFGFGQAKADKKLEIAPPFGNLEALIDTKPAAAWMYLGGITVNLFNSDDQLIDTKKISIKAADIPGLIQQGTTQAKYSISDLPIGVYKMKCSAKTSILGTVNMVNVPLEIKAGRTTKLNVIIKEMATNAKLNSITPSMGELKPVFKANTKIYNVELAYDDIVIPTVEVKTEDPNATAVITQPTSVDGTATILVTAENGTTTSTYTVKFTKADPPILAEIDRVDSVNGSITINLLAKPTKAPEASDFTATVKINEADYVALSLSDFVYDNNTKITYNFIKIDETDIVQNVVVNVTMGSTTKEAPAFTISPMSINVEASMKTVQATNGTVTITLQEKPTVAPVEGDFTAKIGETALLLNGFTYNEETLMVTYIFVPIVEIAEVQSIIVTITLGIIEKSAAAFTIPAIAETGSLRGKVTTKVLGKYIPTPEVKVTINGQETKTNWKGEYHFDAIPTGTYTIEFSIPGVTKTANVTIVNGSDTSFDFKMN